MDPGTASSGGELWVGPGQEFTTLRNAVANSLAGDTIYIAAGTYDIGEVTIPHDLTIIGVGGEVILTSSSQVAKGLLVTLSGVNLRVENLTFLDASSPDRNGAGIRHQGDNLTVIDSQFISNENGILATSSSTGIITIKSSAFIDNGYGDGRSHGIYINHVSQLIIDDSEFSGTNVGHHVKSLADYTSITNSILDDAGGTASYNIDVTRGGDLYVANNLIIQSATTDNPYMINYATDRGGEAGTVTIVNNTVINFHSGGTFLRNATDSIALIQGNTFDNASGGSFDIADGPADIIDASHNGGSTGPTDTTGTTDTTDTTDTSTSTGDTSTGDTSGSNTTVVTNTGTSTVSIGSAEVNGQIQLDAFLQPQNPGDVVGFRLVNNSGADQTADIMTIGQVFVQGDVPAGSALIAMINGQQICGSNGCEGDL